MLADLVLPNVGFGMEEGRVLNWLKQPGDRVRKGEAVAEVEGDKATVELEATVDGTLEEILVPVDQVVSVGTVLARVRTGDIAEPETAIGKAPAVREEYGEVDDASPATPGHATAQGAAAESARVSPVAQRLAQERGVDLASVSGSGPGGRITREDVEAHIARGSAASAGNGKALAAPAVRKLARDSGIDLSSLRGSGEGGRVTRADVEAALRRPAPAAPAPAAQPAQPAPAPAPASTPAQPSPAPAGAERWETPMSNMRQVIARRLQKIAQEAPHFYTTAELDFTDALRALPGGVGINALLLYLVTQTLKEQPALNATYEDGKLYSYAHVNLGIAVALPDGLISPVLHRADDFSLTGLADRSKELIGRAREGRLRADELGGGTFTISNLGIVQQIERFTAILNPPQVGILAVGAARERPVVINGGLHIRTTAFVTLSADHRVVDGLVAARFLEALDGNLNRFARQTP